MSATPLLAAAVLALAAVACAGETETLAARDLRGYGRTSAVLAGNRVALVCESAEKALVWAARYDHVYGAHRVRPGVYRLPGGGWTRLVVKGARVGIAYSETEPAGELAVALPPPPMFLNEYDDCSFRFYYRPGETPKGADGRRQAWTDYDPVPEFDFARANGRAGFVFWNNPHACDTAAGFDQRRHWDWAKALADARELPVVLNTNLAVPMSAMDAHREASDMRAPGFVGSYHAVGNPHHAGEGFLDWSDLSVRQDLLDDLAAFVRDADTTNVINLLEPHGELNHGPWSVFLEHGPAVDESFRTMLRERYGSVASVAKRWREPSLRTWGDVRFPAVCEFAGYGPDAVDLEGPWAVRELGVTNAWGRILRMPGHDVGLFLDRRPREFRRRFDLPATSVGARTWLYVWDLADTFRARVVARLNGKTVMDDAVGHFRHHWAHAEVTDALKAGVNDIALELPSGKACYKIYLTHEEPRPYPYFGAGRNAKWADWCAWQEWSRARAVRRGLDTLRSVEPDKTIVAMAPGAFFNTMREFAAEYGTRFHDTGSMAAYWWNLLPMLMHSKGLAFSLEPGGPASDREGFRRMTNFYLSEGVNAIHYFIHVGSVMWHEGIRAEFERRLPALGMMGRCTVPDCEIAMVADSAQTFLTGYPWGDDPDAAYPAGYDSWRFPSALGARFDLDAVTPCDLLSGDASRYRFLLDANTTVMTREVGEAIDRYVRAGGTYVAMFETGRHTPEAPDRWVLQETSGVKVKRLSRYARRADAGGAPRVTLTDGKMTVRVKPGNGLYPEGDGRLSRPGASDGAFLQPAGSGVATVLEWADGSAAVTVRTLGKGRFVTFGLRPDNIHHAREHEILGELLARLGAREKLLDATCGRGFGRHYVTTDGLSDVWYADAGDRPGPYALRFRDGRARALRDVLTGGALAPEGTLGANDFVMGTSPRGENALAAGRWVKSEFGRWRGGGRKTAPPGSDVAHAGPGRHRDILDLSSMLDGAKASADSAAEGAFTVPADWTDGDIELWCVGLYTHFFAGGHVTVELNGQSLGTSDGVAGMKLPLKAGQRFDLRLKVTGDRHPSVRGFRGPAYLFYRPHRAPLLDLAGDWQAYATFTDPRPRTVSLPGAVTGCAMLRRTFRLDAEPGGRVRLVFTGRGDGSGGVIVNGRYLRRHHHRFGDVTDLDITPWIRRGAENEIILVHITPSDRFDIAAIGLGSVF